jgi:hypothetical protein
MSSYFAEAEDSLLRAQPRVALRDDCNPGELIQSYLTAGYATLRPAAIARDL